MATPQLDTERLRLTPLRVADAREMVLVLGDDELYTFTGDHSPGLSELEARYRAQVAGSPSPHEVWHNWIIRMSADGSAVGFVQATVRDQQAELAWLVGVGWQGQGIATEAGRAMSEWLIGRGVRHLVAHVHPDHRASAKVAGSLGLEETGVVDSDGEQIWELRLPG